MNIGKANREHKKLVEECMELALVITQQLNKPRVDFTQEIVDEIGDVKWRLEQVEKYYCLLYTSPSPRDRQKSRMPSSA